MQYMKGFVVICLVVCVLFCGCTTEKKPDDAFSDELNIFNWENYFGPTTIEDFESEFGVQVNLFTFDDEEFMLSSLETNPESYDVVVASDMVVSDLIASKSLAELDFGNIPNFDNLYERFQNRLYDSGNVYSVPYLWGTTGVAVNTSVVGFNVSSWSVLWDSNLSGRICMLNNKAEVIGAALKYLGYPLNSMNASELGEAEVLLLEQKPLVSGYDGPIAIEEKLLSGEVVAAQYYSGDAYYVADLDYNISYVIPDEGAALWIDNFVVPVDSPNKYTAEVFINYILRPEVSAAIVNYQWYACPNQLAESLIDAEILEDPGIYPSAEVLGRCEYFAELDALTNSEHNRIWSLLQS